ncbi:hypothetical protein CBR_g34872 [Chara braunii]|uniref:Uncharacterized protein n=1 Tax=Chara braunii TaxID=69332 RepID=A0A388LJJ7_CHABU|nr:hypothetical protein CBR_g34872 [Chara braunii]|eukprot:GBG82496.1 hypothetical protein CBR_g34872 [Chara braunii]
MVALVQWGACLAPWRCEYDRMHPRLYAAIRGLWFPMAVVIRMVTAPSLMCGRSEHVECWRGRSEHVECWRGSSGR